MPRPSCSRSAASPPGSSSRACSGRRRLASMLDGKLLCAAGYLAVAGGCSLFGVIHSPLVPAVIALPSQVVARMPHDAATMCQSPYHWAAAYGLAAAVLVGLAALGGQPRTAGGS